MSSHDAMPRAARLDMPDANIFMRCAVIWLDLMPRLRCCALRAMPPRTG